MISDPVNGLPLLFGGWQQTTASMNGELWQRISGVDTWTLVDSGTGPTPRQGSAAAATQTGMLVFGGNPLTGLDNQTWIWDVVGGAWSQLSPTQSPPVRVFASMASLGGGAALLYGGGFANAQPALSDTWLYAAGQWTPLNLATSPGPRVGAAMARDEARDVVVLFGGNTIQGGTGTFPTDTWEYASGVWTQVATATTPGERMGAKMAYDPVRQRLVLVGGLDGAFAVTSDTWEYNGVDWLRTPTSADVSARFEHSLAYDASIGGLVTFGGTSGTFQPIGDTWALDATLAARRTTRGVGCAAASGAIPLVVRPGLPRLGAGFDFAVANATPGSVGVLIVGTVALPAPVDLTSVGAPGCSLYVANDVTVVAVIDAVGAAAVTLTIPNAASLVGTAFFDQWAVLDSVNALGLVFSNQGYAQVGP